MTIRRFAILAAAATTLAPAPTFPQATIGGEWRADVARFADRVIDAGLAPGLGVAVSRGEWPLYAAGFGLADAATGTRASGHTPFYIASSTKALTATAVVLRAARGEMDLDAPITRYLPTLRFAEPLDAETVTIERLLTMTSGIDDGGPVVVRTAFTGDFTPELLIDLLADYGPAEGGNAFDYGNLGYNILGLALAPGSDDGHGWKDVVRREVLEPLGMASTSARLSTLDPDRIAWPHGIVPGEGWRRIPLAKADANLHAAGGHLTSARDLIRFVAAHAGDGRLEGERVFPAPPIERSHDPIVEQDRTFGPYERFAWGHGWDLARWEGRTIVQRFGAFSGYRSHMSFEPATGIGVVVLTNGGETASPAADLLASYVYDRMVGRPDLEAEYDRRLADLEARAEEYRDGLADHLAERAARWAPLSRPLEDFAGTYESPRLGRMTWMVVAGGLEMRMGVVESRAEVYDAAKDELRVEIGGGTVAAFEFPAGGGPAAAITVRGERFERME